MIWMRVTIEKDFGRRTHFGIYLHQTKTVPRYYIIVIIYAKFMLIIKFRKRLQL